jgi:hypothetical protein
MVAAEGDVDGVVAVRLLAYVGIPAGVSYITRGKDRLKSRLAGYNTAARFGPWFVLVDLNARIDCAPPLKAQWLPSPAPRMCFRVVVRTVEAWLMSDSERLSQFLGISPNRIPRDPESERHPKETMVNLARQSRNREIREDMVPREGSGRSIGNAYCARLIEFASRRWRPDVASRRSDSLRRCLNRLKEMRAAL